MAWSVNYARFARTHYLRRREPSGRSNCLSASHHELHGRIMRSHVSQSLGNPSVIRRSVDYLWATHLDQALDEIVEQVARELNLTSSTPILRSDTAAVEIVRKFALSVYRKFVC